jgi:hypothetical protein
VIQVSGAHRLVWAGTVASGLISWRAAVLALAIVLAKGVLRLFTERQRRKTFTALIPHLPEGTVILQQDGPEGQTMTVTMGDSHKRVPQVPGDHG